MSKQFGLQEFVEIFEIINTEFWKGFDRPKEGISAEELNKLRDAVAEKCYREEKITFEDYINYCKRYELLGIKFKSGLQPAIDLPIITE